MALRMPMSLSFARTGNNRALITDRRPVQHRPQTTTDAACTSSPTHERSTRRRQTETHAHAVGVRWVLVRLPRLQRQEVFRDEVEAVAAVEGEPRPQCVVALCPEPRMLEKPHDVAGIPCRAVHASACESKTTRPSSVSPVWPVSSVSSDM